MDKITLNNHALNFSQLPENGVRIDDIVEKAIEVGLHAMSRDYANTGLVSKFSIGDYEKQNKAVKNGYVKKTERTRFFLLIILYFLWYNPY